MALNSIGKGAFVEGCIASIPICVSFAFLFFSVGSLCTTYGYSLAQAASMTALIFAAPLQVFIVQNGESLSLPALLMASLLINFRFLIMASSLSEKFRGVALIKLMMSIPMLSASTFTLSSTKNSESGPALFHYYLGVGSAAIGTAFIATIAGSLIAGQSNNYLTGVINVILPAHFAALTALMWPKLRPISVTIASFFIAPLAGHWLGKSSVIVVPFLVAAFFLFCDNSKIRRESNE
ncbi:MAG: AzlC family ABC transporter permease [Ramlibacter sp.]|nr:AzlC family ABC transporter permease [Ramlibacter sp.]